MSAHEAIPQPMASPAPQRRSLKKKAGQHQPSSGAFTPFTSPSTGRRRKDVGDYWLGHTLGKGSSGMQLFQSVEKDISYHCIDL